MSFYDAYLTKLKSEYPNTEKLSDLPYKLSSNLISSEVIQLPQTIRAQAEETVKALFALRNLPAYREAVLQKVPEWRLVKNPSNFAALMSYDFHIDETKNLRLIEINTNASSSLIGTNLYKTHGLANPFSSDFQKEIVATFKAEWALFSGTDNLKSIAIIDENPETQKLFIEFLLYKELFEREGLACTIADSAALTCDQRLKYEKADIDLVYNRDTDFYFHNLPQLKKAFTEQRACFSPNPFEYLLLADKKRLLELSNFDYLDQFGLSPSMEETLKRALIPTLSVRDNQDFDFWSQRKKFFFKPAQSYGGKAAYRGASISRGVFENILKGDYVAQEYVPAPTWKTKSGEEFKYDLRFYVHKDKVQLVLARLYQGQTTNVQTPGGGLTALQFT